jgi:hypothetical protein
LVRQQLLVDGLGGDDEDDEGGVVVTAEWVEHWQVASPLGTRVH